MALQSSLGSSPHLRSALSSGYLDPLKFLSHLLHVSLHQPMGCPTAEAQGLPSKQGRATLLSKAPVLHCLLLLV